jgi:hypothetical protein
MDTSAKMMLECTEVLIQAEVHQRLKPEFESKYWETAGSKPCGQSYHDNKKPCAVFQVYFNGPKVLAANLRVFGFAVEEFQHGQFQYCVSSETLFWKLIRNGFRLGENQSEAKRRLEMEAVALLR